MTILVMIRNVQHSEFTEVRDNRYPLVGHRNQRRMRAIEYLVVVVREANPRKARIHCTYV